MNLKPLKNKLVVEKIENPNVTDTGIFIVTTSKERFAFGTVKAIGPEILDIAVDDVVMYNPYSGTNVDLDKSYTMLYYDDIYGIINALNNGVLSNVDAFKILHNNDVIVEVNTVKKEVVHTSGIILTTQASVVEDRPTKGKIVSKSNTVNSVDINDIVEFELTAGIDLEVNLSPDTHYVLMSIDRVIGKYI